MRKKISKLPELEGVLLAWRKSFLDGHPMNHQLCGMIEDYFGITRKDLTDVVPTTND